jgi:hypothetical protein
MILALKARFKRADFPSHRNESRFQRCRFVTHEFPGAPPQAIVNTRLWR